MKNAGYHGHLMIIGDYQIIPTVCFIRNALIKRAFLLNAQVNGPEVTQRSKPNAVTLLSVQPNHFLRDAGLTQATNVSKRKRSRMDLGIVTVEVPLFCTQTARVRTIACFLHK